VRIDGISGGGGARVAGAWLIFVVALCFAGPLLAPDPYAIDAASIYAPPSAAHWLGTDELGRDVLARVLVGGRVSLLVGLLAAALSTAIGALVGGTAAYLGGRVDAFLMRIVDLGLIVPRFPLLVLLMSVDLGAVPSWLRVTLIVAALGWMDGARLARGICLPLRDAAFVQAARAMGLSHAAILRRHILPNAAGPLAVAAALEVGQAMIYESALGFLGFSVAPPEPSWGALLAAGLSYAYEAPLAILAPGLLTALSVAAVQVLADALRDAIDPRRPLA